MKFKAWKIEIIFIYLIIVAITCVWLQKHPEISELNMSQVTVTSHDVIWNDPYFTKPTTSFYILKYWIKYKWYLRGIVGLFCAWMLLMTYRNRKDWAKFLDKLSNTK